MKLYDVLRRGLLVVSVLIGGTAYGNTRTDYNLSDERFDEHDNIIEMMDVSLLGSSAFVGSLSPSVVGKIFGVQRKNTQMVWGVLKKLQRPLLFTAAGFFVLLRLKPNSSELFVSEGVLLSMGEEGFLEKNANIHSNANANDGEDMTSGEASPQPKPVPFIPSSQEEEEGEWQEEDYVISEEAKAVFEKLQDPSTLHLGPFNTVEELKAAVEEAKMNDSYFFLSFKDVDQMSAYFALD